MPTPPLSLALLQKAQAEAEGFQNGPHPALNPANLFTQASEGNPQPTPPLPTPTPYYPSAETPNLQLSTDDMPSTIANNFVILDTFLGSVGGTWNTLTGTLGTTQVIPFNGPTIGIPDSGISRAGVASLAIGNGTAGDFSGTLKLQDINVQGPTATSYQVRITGETTAGLAPITVYSSFAEAADFYVFADQGFRSPFVNFLKSRGTQAAPTPVTFTGYELDSLGGINFKGYDGTNYVSGCSILANNDQTWDATHHVAHISIYDTIQVAQFGGVDPSGQFGAAGTANIIFYRNLAFGGNLSGDPIIVAQFSPVGILIARANDLTPAQLSAGTIMIGPNGQTITTGSGSPQGVVTAPIGSLYLNFTGTTSTSLWVKESTTGNTGWTAK